MAINRKPSTTGDGRLEDTELANNKSEYNNLTKEEVVKWRDTLFSSIGKREDEQAQIKAKEGSEDAFQNRLKTDPEFKAKWEGHEERIKREEKAYELANEWLNER